MQPGIYRHVAFAEYLSWPALSQSTLKEGRESMAHLKAAIDGERIREVSDEMALGTALHTAFLEPELMGRYVVEWTGGRRFGGKWDDFQTANEGKVILTPDYYARLIGMVRSLRLHPFVREWSTKIQDTEVSIIGDVEGVRMKSRCDAMTSDPLVDLKSTRSTNPVKMMRSVLDFGYHIQAHIYRVQFNRERFVLLCVENQPPFDVVPYELSPAVLRAGEREAVDLLEQYKECLRRNEWPGRSSEIVTLEAPEFLSDGGGVMIGNQTAFEE